MSKFLTALQILILQFIFYLRHFCDKTDLKLTPEPFRRDVLQEGERNAEKSDEQVADSQGADENIGGRLNRPFLQDDVNNQSVSGQSHDEDQHVHDDEDGLGAVGQLGDVDERLDVVSVDELLAAQVIVTEHLLQLFRSYLTGLLVRLRRRCCHPGAGWSPKVASESRSSLL